MAAVSGKLRRMKRDMEAWVGESLENKPEGNHLDDHKYLTVFVRHNKCKRKEITILYKEPSKYMLSQMHFYI